LTVAVAIFPAATQAQLQRAAEPSAHCGVPRVEVKWVAGMGLGGQRLFVVPAYDMVVMITGGLYVSPQQRWVPLELFNRFVLAGTKEMPQ
jgi:hypothetical protein